MAGATPSTPVGLVLRNPLRDLRGLVYEAGVGLEYAALRRAPVYRGHGVAHGAGAPVLLLPGFLTSQNAFRVMGSWLARNGYRAERATRRLNTACGEFSVQAIERRIERIHADSGRRVALVAHSRGGHFARVVARRRPDLVAGILTLGEPPLDFTACNVAVVAPAFAVAALGTAGVPGMMGFSCFYGDCCETFRAELLEPLPESVAHVAVHSPRDGIVHHGFVDEPHAVRWTIRASHLGMLANPEAYQAVADGLAVLAAAGVAAPAAA